MCGSKPSPTVTLERPPCFIPFFRMSSRLQPDCTRRDSTVLGIIRTLSRTDRIFINLPVSEARDFHCCSHFFQNPVHRSIPSDHAAVRLVSQNPDVQTSPFLLSFEAASR